MKKHLVTAVILGATLGVIAPVMAADIAITLQNGSASVTDTATGTSVDVGPQNLNGVTVTLSSAEKGTSPNALSEGNILISNTTGTTQTLQIAVSANGYIGPDNIFPLSATIIDNLGVITLAGSWYVDPLNALGGQTSGTDTPGTQLGSFNSGPITGPFSFSDNATGFDFVGSPFSMSEQLTVTLAPGAQIGVQGISMEATSVVPEPSTWAMALGGFGIIGLLAFRKHRQERYAVV